MLAPVKSARVRNSTLCILTNIFTYLSFGTQALGFLLRRMPALHTEFPELGVCDRTCGRQRGLEGRRPLQSSGSTLEKRESSRSGKINS